MGKDYSKSKAVKQKRGLNIDEKTTQKDVKKVSKKIKKSPILILIVFALIIGAVAGYFLFSYTSDFSMNGFAINGESVVTKDYIEVEVKKYKEEMLEQDADATMQEIFDSIKLEDAGVTCKFLGQDVSNTVKIKFSYREDITHDAQQVDKIDVSVPGVYYIEYTSSHIAFKNVKLVRTVVVMEVEQDG